MRLLVHRVPPPPVERREADARREERAEIEAPRARVPSVRLFTREILGRVSVRVQLFALDRAVELHDVGQVELDALLDDGLDHVDVYVHLRVGEVDRVRPRTRGAPARVEVERGEILHDLVQGLLLELVLLAQSDQLVGAELADSRSLRHVVALNRLKAIHRVVVHSFSLQNNR